MSLLCLLFIGYACCGASSYGCGSSAASLQGGCGNGSAALSGGCGNSSAALQGGCAQASSQWQALPCCCRKSGCTGFGSTSGVCGDAAYYARQYALCRCCCGN